MIPDVFNQMDFFRRGTIFLTFAESELQISLILQPRQPSFQGYGPFLIMKTLHILFKHFQS